MSKANRDKGKRFEREIAKWFRESKLDLDARRGFQMRGGGEAPDVITSHFWVECKDVDKLSTQAALARACSESGAGALPVLIHKRRRQPTALSAVTMRLSDWTKLALAYGDAQHVGEKYIRFEVTTDAADLLVCPRCGDYAEFDRCLPPNPYLCEECTDVLR